MNRWFILSLMFIGLCSSMLFGYENNDTELVKSNPVEIVSENDSIADLFSRNLDTTDNVVKIEIPQNGSTETRSDVVLYLYLVFVFISVAIIVIIRWRWKNKHTTMVNKRELSLEAKIASMKDGFNSLSDQLWDLFKTIEDTLHETDSQMVIEQQKRVNDLEKELEWTRHRINKLNIKLQEIDEEKKAIKASEDKWRNNCDKLVSLNEELKQQTDQYKKKCMDEEREYLQKELKKRADQYKKKSMDEECKRKALEVTIKKHEQTITERDQLINRMQIEAKPYTKKVIFLRSAQNFAQRATVFFDTLDQLLTNVNRLKMYVPKDVNADDYNYYLIRIERKFYASMAKLENLSQWRFELQLLAQQEIVPASGLIDKKMGGGKVKDNEWESTLRMLFYHDIMSSLAGAAVVMSDELSLMLPQMVSGVSGTDEFAKITEKLRKAIADMGYELNYVKPFTRFDGYDNVRNIEYTKADVPHGTIFEVLKMALNFGSNKSMTEVSAKL